LLKVRQHHPDRLVIKTDAHARRLIFAEDASDRVPRAVGVEVALGEHLYRASPKHAGQKDPECKKLFARQEIIVAGGAFNSPQLLMLSGIGDRKALWGRGIHGPCDAASQLLSPPIHLPGVGANLQDRYEISVISKTSCDFSSLKGATFDPSKTKGDL